MDNFEQRLSILETWRIAVDVTLGKNEVHRGNVEQQLSDIKEEIKEFKKTMKGLSLTIWGAFVLLAVRWVASGGLTGFTNHLP